MLEPSTAILVGMPWTLHDPVQRYVVDDHYFSHQDLPSFDPVAFLIGPAPLIRTPGSP
jgi:hypothetical protein